MYLDTVDNIIINKQAIRLFGVEPALYWAELTYILTQVSRKKTYDERGFFKLDRVFMERETSLTTEVQLNCDKVLSEYGILAADESDPDRIAIDVKRMNRIIVGEEDPKLDIAPLKTEEQIKLSKKDAKIRGMKSTMCKAITEDDEDLKLAYTNWVGSLIDAQNCRVTKAVVTLFLETIRNFTKDKTAQLRIIEIATINNYKDANWAINRYNTETRGYSKPSAAHLSEQKIGTAVSDEVSF